jgi:5-formyltetrahydrofolate cyclo-ligase
VVPGVAFDLRGARLGRGRGWYDRALARYPAGTRLGLAYEFQVVPALPEAPWDVRMHALVTEARLIGEAAGASRAHKED